MNLFKNWFRQFIILTLMGCILILSCFISDAFAQSGWRNPDRLFKAMELKEGDWVADVGSREGYYTIRMSPIVGETGHIFAVDIETRGLERLHNTLKEKNIENVSTIYSLPANPMLPPGSLDAVLIRNAYHEFTEYRSMLQHIRKALKPGGRLVIAEPTRAGSESRSRQQQADSHEIAMDLVLADLKEAGFEITGKIERFTEIRRRQYYYMIVAVPIAS